MKPTLRFKYIYTNNDDIYQTINFYEFNNSYYMSGINYNQVVGVIQTNLTLLNIKEFIDNNKEYLVDRDPSLNRKSYESTNC